MGGTLMYMQLAPSLHLTFSTGFGALAAMEGTTSIGWALATQAFIVAWIDLCHGTRCTHQALQ
jgi:hypothetical protein